MKKTIIFLLACMLIYCGAIAESDSEIKFSGIPWLADETTVINALNENGLLRSIEGLEFSHDNVSYLLVDDIDFTSPDRVVGADDVSFIVDLGGNVKGKIAGYPIKNIVFTFAYDGGYKLIAARVELIKAEYETLKNKLIKVYGEPETKETGEGIWSTVWKGKNNSAVLLYTQSEGYDYILMYGRLDAAEILSQCLAPADSDDVSGL